MAAFVQANGAAKAAEAKPEGEANGSAGDVDMKDAAGASDSAAADSNVYTGQLTGKSPPITFLNTSLVLAMILNLEFPLFLSLTISLPQKRPF